LKQEIVANNADVVSCTSAHTGCCGRFLYEYNYH